MSKRFTKRGYNQVMLRFLVDMDMKTLELVALVAAKLVVLRTVQKAFFKRSGYKLDNGS